ncbi:hypothetical protein Ae201684_018906 [Aphanomyces euteiches]|uniref:Uncharacterized protein n=1 Tax=Aphanomyces euteiches TaxID=100861 RepID=A0A6G0W5Q9_9STRA|nr:hypothetical protein Ae201684_018906 [Aphanomyces euteiches]
MSTDGAAPETTPAKNELEKLDQMLIEEEAEPAMTKDEYIAILKERLNRRTMLIDVVRSAYYRDIVVVKEALLAREAGASVSERVNTLPSTDLRDLLPLFAPSETFLRVHPCEKCGGVVELVHGETKERNEARQQCNRALKAEQHMKGIVHRLRDELKEATEISEALHQRIRALAKENAFTLEQLQVARKAERDQKSTLADLKSKLQHATANSNSVAKLTQQLSELNIELEAATKQKLTAFAAREDLQDEFDQLQAAYHVEKNAHTRLDAELTTIQVHYEECKTQCAYLTTELHLLSEKHRIQLEMDEILQTALSKTKEELASHVARSDQIKRQLEDQLASEEIAREEAQEKYVEEKKRNKHMQREMEAAQREAAEYQDQFNAYLVKRDMENSANDAASDLLRHEMQAQAQRIEVLGMWENEWLSQLRARVLDNDIEENDEEDNQPKFDALGYESPEESTQKDEEEDNEEETIRPTLAAPAVRQSPPPIVTTQRELQPKQAIEEASHDVQASAPPTTPVSPKKAKRQETKRPSTKSSSNSQAMALFKELEEAKEKAKIQRQKLHDLEKILASTKAQVTELTMSNQVLQGTLQDLALTTSQANQSESQITTMLREAREQVELLTKERDRNDRKTSAFEGFFAQIGSELYFLVEDPTLLTTVSVPIVIQDDDSSASNLKNGLTKEMLAKKQAIQEQHYLEQMLNNYITAYSERVDIFCGNIKRAQDILLETTHDLMLSQRKAENQFRLLEESAIETTSLKHSLENERATTTKLDRVVKITVSELNEVNEKMRAQKKMVEEVDVERNKLQEEKRRIAFMMMEKSKTLDREMDLNEQLTKKVQALQSDLSQVGDMKNRLVAELQTLHDEAAFRKATNQEVGILVKPPMQDAEMQSDKWKPQGLILRQRNSPMMTPQRYEGPPQVMVACPSLDTLLREKAAYSGDDRPSTAMSSVPAKPAWITKKTEASRPSSNQGGSRRRLPVNLPRV